MNSPQSVSTPGVTNESYHPIAPVWHTIVVLVVMLGLSLAGSVNRGLSPQARAHGRPVSYVAVMLFEWATVAFIWWGVSGRGVIMRNLVGGKWQRVTDTFRDLGIAIGFLIIAQLVLGGLGHLLNATPNQAIRNLLPQGTTETVLFLAVAATAGFCEEVIFRGYLQRQFAALTRAAAGGIVLQGIAFGAGHGYQGWKYMLIIAVFGTMFGTLAHWRCSLRPGMLAHFLQDGAGGLFGRHLMR
jgi:membrane protease YdiL (CAAX protease family)